MRIKMTNVLPSVLFWANVFLLSLFSKKNDTGGKAYMEQKMVNLVSAMSGLRY